MQKLVVISNRDLNVVYLSEVSDRKYYGILVAFSSRIMGFISRQETDDGLFRAMSFENLTRGDGWGDFCSSTLGGCIKNIVESGHFKVKQFDTFEELLQAALDTGKQ